MKSITLLLLFLQLIHYTCPNNNEEESCSIEEPTVDCGCSHQTTKTKEILENRMDLDLEIVKILGEKKANDFYRDYVSRSMKMMNPLVEIESGEFFMGTDDPIILEDGENPKRKVKVSGFKIMKKEISNLEFLAFKLSTKYKTDAEKFGWSFVFKDALSKELEKSIQQVVESVPWWYPVNNTNFFFPFGPDRNIIELDLLNHPVVHVSHTDAKEFCKWLGYRLPREAEFEYVLKYDKRNSIYPWGDLLYMNIDNPNEDYDQIKIKNRIYMANLWQGKFPKENLALDNFTFTNPVDQFCDQIGDLEICNMIGNAWEWVADAWSVNHMRYKDLELEDPQFELSMDLLDDPQVERVKRGGSYMCHSSYCYRYRSVSRSHNTADSSAQNLSFRCVKDLL